jgi:hypothetical protein
MRFKEYFKEKILSETVTIENILGKFQSVVLS